MQLVYNRSLILPLPTQGKPFDDGAYAIVPPVTGVHSVLIRHGNYIDGIQATYILEDGQSRLPTMVGKVEISLIYKSAQMKLLQGWKAILNILWVVT